MSENLFEDVKDFHEKMGVPVNTTPHFPSEAELKLRLDFILEEYVEMLDAIENTDLVEFADGLGDMIYTIVGTMLVAGIPCQKVWDEIHRTNMAKEPSVRREDGKILKPKGWEPPRIREILLAHCAEVTGTD
jgi:predicted HAD superfamily Cof-like phosphohydrolase